MTEIRVKRRRRVWPILLAMLAVLAIAFAAWALPNKRLSRIIAVTTLFDADKIVGNFSNMDRAFNTRALDVPIRDDLPRALEPLPDTVDIVGTDRPTEDVLAELDTTALVILRDGVVIHEDYRLGTGADDRRISWSVAKSFMSGLYGNALASGQIASLDDDITVYVPELKGSAYEGASLRNILNMSSGIRFNENYMDQSSDINRMGRTIALGGSLDDYTMELTDRQFEPGTDWQYVSMDTHVAAWALRRATGKSLHELFEQTYGPLGFKAPPYYTTDGEGVAFALGGLNLTTIDYAKFGQLFLQEGAWEGEQLIPADWVRASTVHSAPGLSDRGVGYGYQWWVPQNTSGPEQGDYFAVGIYGQYVYVDPARNIVIAKNAADREFAFADEVGTHSMNKNIELLRSLSAQLGTSLEPIGRCEGENETLRCTVTLRDNGEVRTIDITPAVDRFPMQLGPERNYTERRAQVDRIERIDAGRVRVHISGTLTADGVDYAASDTVLISEGVELRR